MIVEKTYILSVQSTHTHVIAAYILDMDMSRPGYVEPARVNGSGTRVQWVDPKPGPIPSLDGLVAWSRFQQFNPIGSDPWSCLPYPS